MTNEEALWNWSYYVTLWLETPIPSQPNTCRSFEKNHVADLGNVMDDEDYPDMPSIDWKLGELYESCMRNLPEHHRRALKAYYVQYQYQSNHIIASNLRTTVKKFEHDLSEAKTRLSKEVNKKLSRN
jgi:DNA-directed RNA polymerase specialized sigma24 family protein